MNTKQLQDEFAQADTQSLSATEDAQAPDPDEDNLDDLDGKLQV